MLNRLSKCQQEIALAFMFLFIIGGIIPLKAQASYNSYANYRTSSSNSFAKKRKAIVNEQIVTNDVNTPGFSGAILPLTDNSIKVIPAVSAYIKDAKMKPFIGCPGQPEM